MVKDEKIEDIFDGFSRVDFNQKQLTFERLE